MPAALTTTLLRPVGSLLDQCLQRWPTTKPRPGLHLATAGRLGVGQTVGSMSCHRQRAAQGPDAKRLVVLSPAHQNPNPKTSVESMPGQRMKIWHNTAPTKAPSLLHAGALYITIAR